jgi:hypothetical protein
MNYVPQVPFQMAITVVIVRLDDIHHQMGMISVLHVNVVNTLMVPVRPSVGRVKLYLVDMILVIL